MLSNCALFFSATAIISLFVRFFFTVKSKVGNLMTEALIWAQKLRIKSRSCYSWSEFCHWLQKCYNFPLWNLNSLPGESCVCFPWIPNSVSSEILSIRECCRKSTGEEMEHLVLAETHLSGRLKWKAKFRE